MKLDRRIQDLFSIELPIIQAPMAGSVGSEMVIAVSEAGGLGSLPCAMLSVEQARAEIGVIRQRTSRPINLNFFCHAAPNDDPQRETASKLHLERYYLEFGIDPLRPVLNAVRTPFGNDMCDVVEEFRPEVVSFHFGLPDARLVDRVKATGAKIISSATSVDEARWLVERGCDAIIAQGYEAGGHRGIFLSADIRTQAGTMALVPQVVDAVGVPVIAAGGIADARGIVAAFALGASAVQIGTAYLLCPEAKTSPVHRAALKRAKDNDMVLTNVLTGRPARGILNRLLREVGPMSGHAPQFPLAAGAMRHCAPRPKLPDQAISRRCGRANRLRSLGRCPPETSPDILPKTRLLRCISKRGGDRLSCGGTRYYVFDFPVSETRAPRLRLTFSTCVPSIPGPMSVAST